MKFRGFVSVLMAYWLMIAIIVFMGAVFFGAPMLGLYRKIKTLPGVSALPLPAK